MAKAPTMDEWAEKLGTKALNGFVYEGRTLREWIDLMASGKLVILPNNATNGDVIKAVFPDATISELKSKHERTKVAVEWGFELIPSYYNLFYKEWWDSSYDGGDIDGSC